MRRIAILLMLAAIAGPGMPVAAAGTFIDDDGDLHEPALEAIAAAGISNGCAAQLFCPTRPVSRQEMASFLVRGFQLPPDPTDYFADADG
jgi:hypothetical protein